MLFYVLVDGLLVVTYLDVHRVVHETVGQPLDLFRPGGTEHAHLSTRVHLAQDLLDLRLEAHVQHAVGLVQDQVGHSF